MTFMLKETGRIDPYGELEDPPATFGESFSAGVTAERIETDAWSRRDRDRLALLEEMRARLGDDYGEGPPQIPPNQPGSTLFPDRELDHVLARIAQVRREEPVGRFEDLPASRDEFERMVTERRRAELEDAEAVMASGSPVGSFFGRMYGAATDESTLVTLPFGVAGRGLATVVAGEAALNVATEALTLPRQFEVADELGRPPPNVALQLGGAGVLGGALGGLMVGGQRALEYGRTVQQARQAQRSGERGLEQERRIAELRARLDGQPLTYGTTIDQPEPPGGTLADTVGSERGDGPSMADFDFSPTGNASPRTNRVGYVFGRLLELGYEPHIAAGLVGNLMQESGPGLNTRAVGDNGNAFGMGQWNGPRRIAYLRFAEERGADPGDLDTQIAWLHHELTGPEATAAARIMQADTAREAAAIASQEFWRPGIPHLARRQAYAGTLVEQFDRGAVPRWEGAVSVAQEGTGFTGYATSRPYTETGQVIVGDDWRIDVDYEVVDLSELRQASGRLQPRDRSQVNSDAWVADTAARLDPAQLMPAVWGDRGTPIVGPDGVIESGNGRVRALERAFTEFRDRAEAYIAQIETTTGRPVPEGIERPVLIARRKTELTPEERVRFVADAQDSGVARMTASERAQIGRRALDADLMAKYRPERALTTAENRDFARDFAGHFPRSERNAFIGRDGKLSLDGVRAMRDALFARAWEDPGLIARAVETEDDEMAGLLAGLARAAAPFARLRAEIEAGLVRPEMDISPHVMEAARIILAAQDARAQGGQLAEILEEMLSQQDIFGAGVAPLSAALARYMAPGGRMLPAPKIAELLTRYADEARQAGRTGDSLEPVGPLDVLRRIDAQAFGELEEIGEAEVPQYGPAARPPEPDPAAIPGAAFAEGVMSPEAEAGDDMAEAALRDATDAGARPGALAQVEDPAALEAQLKEAQPFETMDELFERAPAAQSFLDAEGARIAEDLGVEFKTPGLKKRATAEEKMARKKYASPRQMTDIARGGFLVPTADEAEAVVDRLAATAQVMDEGWAVTPAGYLDRKVLVRTPSGVVAEVQIWSPRMLEAKDSRGHALYERARESDDPAEKAALEEEMRALYAEALAAEDPSFANVAGTSNVPNVRSNLDFSASADGSTRAVSNTSSASTGSQAPPGSSSASASPRAAENRTAGRPSQSANVGAVMGDTSTANIGTPGAARNADVEILDALDELNRAGFDPDEALPDGTTPRALLDELEADEVLDTVIDLCAVRGAG